MNLAPPVELGEGWILGSDCDLDGTLFDSTHARSGTRSIRIRSRSIGPTCGHFERSIDGLKAGKLYRIAVWWDAQGVSTGKSATVLINDVPVGTISGTTPVAGEWHRFMLPQPYVPAVDGPITLKVSQVPGSGSAIFDRYFDDVEIEEIVQGVKASAASLAPSAIGESTAPSASAKTLGPGGKPGYGR